MAPVVIGIAGGTGSGKSTLVRRIVEHLPGRVAVLPQDAYYLDRRDLPFEERARLNYDHPLAFDTPLLIRHLQALKQGKPVRRPVYDFTQHLRDRRTVWVEPRDVIVVEGILVLAEEALRPLLDIKIFVDTDADVRILRRLVRDIEKRGRTLESVISQYLETVKPMHEQFVEPSKRYADLIIPEGGFNRVAVDVLLARIRAALQNEATLRPATSPTSAADPGAAAGSPGAVNGASASPSGGGTGAPSDGGTGGRRQRRRQRRKNRKVRPAVNQAAAEP
ncbi:uridine kinase [Thermaerobacter marianensis DSM 12885]|uniref:Uridine kinase n=1 Tax=Thermaerobacter marianensis (strain ATCC 700841 / DSM 12885 / JCM 10246 / 7p75a) TaxID=644966 RepID=E6SLK4_THEM7|nr:uridine kinase [Thermaerobacter marianensis DSM 12885]